MELLVKCSNKIKFKKKKLFSQLAIKNAFFFNFLV